MTTSLREFNRKTTIASLSSALRRGSALRWLLCGAALLRAAAQTPPPFEVEEATIVQVQGAIRAHKLTCRALVDAYLRRIDAYDKNGPALNAIVILNPDAAKEAD